MTHGDSVIRWILSGRVQGVGFRWYTARKARSLDLAGWVTNLPDGTVEVVARGPREYLDALEATILTGPDGANVESVEKSDIPPHLVPRNDFGIR
jgi:acylphosphatase